MNNTLFRLGTESGWCTTTHLVGWRLPLHVDFLNYEDIENVRPHLWGALAAAPNSVHMLLWVMAMLKRDEPVNPLCHPGLLTSLQDKYTDRIELSFGDHHGLELRLKIKQSSKGPQLDLIAERVW